MNIAEYLDTIKKKNIEFSDSAKKELEMMRDITEKAIDKVGAFYRGTIFVGTISLL